MKDSRSGKPVVNKFRHAVPRQPASLATPPEAASPQVRDVMVERPECPGVRGHCVICEVSRDHCPQPPSLFGNGLVPPVTELRLDVLKRSPHAITPTVAEELEGSPPGFAADEDDPKKVKVSGLPNPRRWRRAAAKRPNSSNRVLSS